MPARAVRSVAAVALGALALGALYLYAVRGQAILLDLSGLARSILCL